MLTSFHKRQVEHLTDAGSHHLHHLRSCLVSERSSYGLAFDVTQAGHALESVRCPSIDTTPIFLFTSSPERRFRASNLRSVVSDLDATLSSVRFLEERLIALRQKLELWRACVATAEPKFGTSDRTTPQRVRYSEARRQEVANTHEVEPRLLLMACRQR